MVSWVPAKVHDAAYAPMPPRNRPSRVLRDFQAEQTALHALHTGPARAAAAAMAHKHERVGHRQARRPPCASTRRAPLSHLAGFTSRLFLGPLTSPAAAGLGNGSCSRSGGQPSCAAPPSASHLGTAAERLLCLRALQALCTNAAGEAGASWRPRTPQHTRHPSFAALGLRAPRIRRRARRGAASRGRAHGHGGPPRRLLRLGERRRQHVRGGGRAAGRPAGIQHECGRLAVCVGRRKEVRSRAEVGGRGGRASVRRAVRGCVRRGRGARRGHQHAERLRPLRARTQDLSSRSGRARQGSAWPGACACAGCVGEVLSRQGRVAIASHLLGREGVAVRREQSVGR
jgi:hypothetical protein